MTKVSRKVKCQCGHLGQCPFGRDPLLMVDDEGTALYRELTEEEQRTSHVAIDQTMYSAEYGDFIGTDDNDRLVVLGRALDVFKAADHTASRQGRLCRADRGCWGKANPAKAIGETS